MNKVSVTAAPTVLLLISALLLESGTVVINSVFAMTLHEMGHLVALRILKADITDVVFGFGICIRHQPLSYRDEIISSLAGPAASLLLSIIFAGLYHIFPTESILVFSGVNLFYCIINLLPALPADGGRALMAAIALVFDIDTAERTLCIATCITGGLLLICGTLQMYFSKGNLTMCAVGAMLLLSYCKKNKNSIESH